MKKIIWIIVGVVVIGGIWWNQSKNQTSETGEPIKIGAALALTGDAAAWGEVERNGINLALNEINSKGGIDGRQLEVVFEDTRSTSKDGISAVQKLLSLNKVSYIIGPTWLDSYPGAQGVVKGSSVVMISPSASITAVQQGATQENLFSTWYRVDAITEGLAKAIIGKGKTKVALVFQNDAYYSEFVDFFKKAAKTEGITIVSEELINPGQSDFKTNLSKVKTSGAEGIVFGMYDEKMVAGFLKDHNQISPALGLYSNEAIRQNFEGNVEYQSLLEGTVFVENAQISKDFVDKYKKAYASAPTFSALNAYDATMIIAKSLKDADQNPSAYLHSNTFSTASFGAVKFNSIGGVETSNKQYQIMEVLNGQIK